MRKLALISAFTVASMATATAANSSPAICWSNFNNAMDACNGNAACEQQANIDLGICLASLDDWLPGCDPGDRC